MKTAEIYKKHIANHENDFEYYVVIFYNGIPQDESRYCHTIDEARDWARAHNATITDDPEKKRYVFESDDFKM